MLRKLEWSRRLSLCVLYSIMVVWGRLSTLFSVSLILIVVPWSCALLFHTEMISSCKKFKYKSLLLHIQISSRLTWKRMDTTAPQISSPTINCSPRIARIRFSQQREANPLRSLTIHLPPSLLASSYHRTLIHRPTSHISSNNIPPTWAWCPP